MKISKKLSEVENAYLKRVKCYVQDEVEHIVIYEVVAVNFDNDNIVTGRYLSEDDARRNVEFNNHLKSLYKLSYYSEKFVWC